MCGGNAGPVLDALDTVLDRLDEARTALESPEPIAAVRTWSMPGHAARVRWPPSWGEPHRIPATRERLLALGAAGGWVAAVSADGRTVTAIKPL
jgi:prephenate dehydrogenase